MCVCVCVCVCVCIGRDGFTWYIAFLKPEMSSAYRSSLRWPQGQADTRLLWHTGLTDRGRGHDHGMVHPCLF